MNHEAFRRFFTDNSLSYRQFADYCCVVRKTTLNRLAWAERAKEHPPAFFERVIPVLIQKCRGWLEENTDKTSDAIDAILKTIFEEDYQPMICERHMLDLEHLEFFGLDRDPFALEADPRSAAEVYTNKELDRIVRRVEAAVKLQGFLAIVGPVGAGKTILKNRIADRLKKQGKAYLLWPRFAEMGKLNAGGIVHYVLEEFGQHGRMRLPLAQRQLERHLEQLSDAGRPVALCFDEGHRLHDSTFSALKNFYELGTGGYEKYLGLILFGQLSLKQRLERAEFREIAERVEVIEMPSLAKHATDYINHRISLAGGNTDKLFESRAIQVIAGQASTPLAIGNLANKALIEAYKKGEAKVLARFLERDTDPKVRQLKKVANA
jgi:type II secretory pathway predicted ATPase ExeA